MGPFPSTSIFDTFNRANEDPLATASGGGTWATLPGAGGFGVTTLEVISNQCAGNGGVGANMYLVGADSADCELWATVPTLGADGGIVDLYARGKDIGSITTLDAYTVRWTKASGTDAIIVTRVDNLAATTIATFNQEVSAGDSFGMRIIGSVIEVFYKASAGSWTSLGTVTDATYGAGGVKLMTISGTTIRVDDIGGGNYTLLPFPLSVSGTLTSSGALSKRDDKTLAGSLTPSGAISKRVNKVYSGTLTSSGALSKRDDKTLAGSLTPSGAISKRVNKVYSGTLASSGLLIKQINKVFSGTLTSIGSFVKQSNKLMAGTLTSAGLLQKQVDKLLSGTLTSSGTLANIKTALLTIGGTLGIGGVLNNQANKVMIGTLSSVGGLAKQVNKLFSGTLTSSGVLSNIKTVVLNIGGTLGSSGALSKQVQKNVSGNLTPVGGLSKQINKWFSGILSSIGTFVGVKTGGVTVLAGFDVVDTRRNPVSFAPLARPLVYDTTQNDVHYDQKHIKTQLVQTRSLTIYGD